MLVYFAYHSFIINVKIGIVKELSVRLTEGADLKRSIEELCLKNGVDTAVLVSCVGSLSKIKIRLAKAVDYLEEENDYEIISANGTISKGKAHLHIAASDSDGKLIGGHLCEGCIINTTCEIVLMVLEEYSSYREYDQNTGYKEIVFKEMR